MPPIDIRYFVTRCREVEIVVGTWTDAWGGEVFTFIPTEQISCRRLEKGLGILKFYEINNCKMMRCKTWI